MKAEIQQYQSVKPGYGSTEVQVPQARVRLWALGISLLLAKKNLRASRGAAGSAVY